MLASIENVIKRFEDYTAVDHLELDIYEGEILGLLGPNGAGKTTAIRMLTGLIQADSGNITVFGQKQSINNLDIRRQIGLVTQEVTVFSDLTARENLMYFGGLYGLKGKELKDNVAEVLEFVGLTQHANKYPSKYSGGMKSRLNIACALVHKPKFVIMDEPTVGIDPQSRNHILDSIRKINAQGTTILYTSHYMEEVEAISSRVAIMDAGRVIAQGSVDELVGRMAHEDTVRFTALQSTQALIENLEAVHGVKSVNVNGNAFQVISSANSGNMNRIMEIVTQHGGATTFSQGSSNLEDVFLTLTGKKLRDSEA